MTINDAQEAHERILLAFDAANTYEDRNGYRKQRNKVLKKAAALIFEAIRAAQPKPEIDFQI